MPQTPNQLPINPIDPILPELINSKKIPFLIKFKDIAYFKVHRTSIFIDKSTNYVVKVKGLEIGKETVINISKYSKNVVFSKRIKRKKTIGGIIEIDGSKHIIVRDNDLLKKSNIDLGTISDFKPGFFLIGVQNIVTSEIDVIIEFSWLDSLSSISSKSISYYRFVKHLTRDSLFNLSYVRGMYIEYTDKKPSAIVVYQSAEQMKKKPYKGTIMQNLIAEYSQLYQIRFILKSGDFYLQSLYKTNSGDIISPENEDNNQGKLGVLVSDGAEKYWLSVCHAMIKSSVLNRNRDYNEINFDASDSRYVVKIRDTPDGDARVTRVRRGFLTNKGGLCKTFLDCAICDKTEAFIEDNYTCTTRPSPNMPVKNMVTSVTNNTSKIMTPDFDGKIDGKIGGESADVELGYTGIRLTAYNCSLTEKRISNSGDSGGAIVMSSNEKVVVGLVLGIVRTPNDVDLTVIIPIEPILKEMNLEISKLTQ